MRKFTFSAMVCWAFFVVTITTGITIGKWKKKIILKWDVSSYYLYLPATFIYQDLFTLGFYSDIDSVYRPSDDFRKYAITPCRPTQRKIIKYPCGVALFELPLFGVACALCPLLGDVPCDGYSEPFQLSVLFSSILFAFLGLLVLRKSLKFYFTDVAVSAALLVIAFGTNFLLYACGEPGLSHIYLFFLFSITLYTTHRWYETPSLKFALLTGLAVGMAALTRPTGSLIAVIPLLWFAPAVPSFAHKMILFRRRWKDLTAAIAAVFFPLFIQMIYWKLVTGHWVYYSYEKEGFDFRHWHIIDGLFSYRKGWFVYSPLAMLGFLGLLVVILRKKIRFYALPFVVYFLPFLWLTFSWWMWYYGGGFGSRVMIESLALLAFPVAALTDYVRQSGWPLKLLFAFIITTGIALNLFQSWQYNKAIIHWDSMNKAYYWHVFGKTAITKEDLRLLEK